MPGAKAYIEELEALKSTPLTDPHFVEAKYGPAELQLRTEGAYITRLLLTTSGGRPVDVLYAGPHTSVRKLDASHIMSPVGPSDGPGGQHGPARWLDYDAPPHLQTQTRNGFAGVQLQSKNPLVGPDAEVPFGKFFELGPHHLYTRTTVYNPTDELRTSIGEHFYFSLEDEFTDGLTVNGQPLDNVLGDGALERVMRGESQFWEGYNGDARIRFPAGHIVSLSTEVDDVATTDTMGMLIWHREDTPSICFEPTIGFHPERGNEGIELADWSSATLGTRIELL